MQTHRHVVQNWGHHWRGLLPAARVTQIAPLAAFSLGILWSGSLTLLTVAASPPLPITDPNIER